MPCCTNYLDWRESPNYDRSRRKAEEVGIDVTHITEAHDLTRLLMEHWARDFRVEDYIDQFAQRIAQAQRRYNRTASYHIRVMRCENPKKPKEAYK